MRFLGTIVNTIGILGGSVIGILISGFLKKHPKLSRLPDAVMKAVAICVIYIGVSGMLNNKNTLVLIISMATGTFLGEIIDIDKHLNSFGVWVERKLTRKNKELSVEKESTVSENTEIKDDKPVNDCMSKGSTLTGGNIAKGFVSGTLLFCIGAMAITGALNSGLSGGQNQDILYAKSVLDTISSIVFGATLGIGTALSAISVFVYQGLIELLSGFLTPVLSEYVIAEMTSVGSLLILGLGLNMLGVTKLKIANMLPAIFMPIFLCLIIH